VDDFPIDERKKKRTNENERKRRWCNHCSILSAVARNPRSHTFTLCSLLSLAFAANTTAAEERGIENGGEERGRRSFGRRFDFQQRERPRRQTFSSGSSVECGGEQKKKKKRKRRRNVGNLMKRRRRRAESTAAAWASWARAYKLVSSSDVCNSSKK
jgi:hypothetical protein